MIIKFDEVALNKAFGPTFVEGMRHIVRQIGALTDQTTLPEVAAMTPIVSGLVITVTATTQAVTELEANQVDQPLSERHLVRRLDDLQSEAERINVEYAALTKAISEVRDEISMFTDPLSVLTDFRKTNTGINTGDETTASIKSKLGITTLSGSNTGDQTLASLGAAALAGSSSQAFATAALTASDQVTGTKTYSAGPAIKATASTAALAATFASTNSDSSHFLVGYSGSTADATPAMWWKTGTTMRFATATDTQAGGFTLQATLDSTGFKAVAGFGCNTKAPQTAYALGAAATDLASVIALANNLQTMAINNGMGS